MLTGDKLETARNIGFSCHLLNNDMYIWECSSKESVDNLFNEAMLEENEKMRSEQRPRALVISS